MFYFSVAMISIVNGIFIIQNHFLMCLVDKI